MRILAILLAFCAAAAQEVKWRTVRRELVEERLEQAVSGNARRMAVLEKMFEEAGCQGGRFAKQPVRGSRLANLVCTLPGAGDAVIVAGAHFDHAGQGAGVIDNWSGAALLPSLFQGLDGLPHRHTFRFVAFTDEETGLRGSEFFVSKLARGERARVKAMVNFDCLGLDSTKVNLAASDKGLVETLQRVASHLNVPLAAVNTHLVGMSDARSFGQRRIPVVDLHSVTQETLRILHSPSDNLNALQRDAYYDTFRLVLVFLALLDVTLE